MTDAAHDDGTVTVAAPPPVRERAIIQRWATIAAVLLLIAGAFALAYLRAASAADTANESNRQARIALHSANVAAAKAKAASDQAQATAACVNAVLAIRNETTTGDATANLAFIRSVTSLFVLNEQTPPEVSQRVLRDFKATSIKTLETLTADARVRAAHPLGQC